MPYGHYILADDGKTPVRCTFEEMRDGRAEREVDKFDTRPV